MIKFRKKGSRLLDPFLRCDWGDEHKLAIPYINSKLKYHYYNNGCIVSLDSGKQIFINSQETDMLSYINGYDDICSISNKLFYEINELDREEILSIVEKFIRKFSEKGIILVSCKPVNQHVKFTGIRNAKVPQHITIEITNKCNLRCIHCYKMAGCGKKDEIDCDRLIKKLALFHNIIPHIQLTGGEPMCHQNFNEILDFISRRFNTVITTTATLISKRNVKHLCNVKMIQVSVYSANATEHERVTLIPGSFNRTIHGIKLLKDNNIPVTVSNIVTKKNMNNMKDLVELAVQLKVDFVSFGLFSRVGRGINLGSSWDVSLEDIERIKEQINDLQNLYKGDIRINEFDNETNVTDQDPLDRGFSCGAGSLHWVIDELGNIKPCFFMPSQLFSSGNFLDDDFDTLIHKERVKGMKVSLDKWDQELSSYSNSLDRVCSVMKRFQMSTSDLR